MLTFIIVSLMRMVSKTQYKWIIGLIITLLFAIIIYKKSIPHLLI
ncbi:MAG TPA: hypothetical protein P5050_04755 [Bacteroidia bacterium]|nr:hypothetical protein [Bacteroidia bacterium]HRS58512.1 hypothetical protein [Bacteroidia bacterium]HRU68543.1 hypothetical protein [Bacteroidia bacterium]